MPEVEKKEKHWYQKLWGKVTASIAILGAVWGILEGVYYFTEQWHDFQLLKKEVKDMKEKEQWVLESLQTVLESREEWSKSYAVGFRVYQETDKKTGNVTWIKRYRDWEGVWHDVFHDAEASRIYGVDYYYYIDETKPPPNNQVYCW